MKKIFLKVMPGIFAFGVTCCGGTLADALDQADYTKHKADQSKKVEVLVKKK